MIVQSAKVPLTFGASSSGRATQDTSCLENTSAECRNALCSKGERGFGAEQQMRENRLGPSGQCCSKSGTREEAQVCGSGRN